MLRIDFLVVIFFVLAAVPASILLDARFLTSTLLFFGLPSLYLLLRQRRPLKRIFSSAVLFGLFFGFLLDFLAELNGAWSWAGTDQIVFPWRIFGVVNIDVMIWFFLWVLFIVLFYEHFIEHDSEDRVSPHYKTGVLMFFGAFFLITLLHFFL